MENRKEWKWKEQSLGLKIFKIIYWLLNVGILYLYFSHRIFVGMKLTPVLIGISVLWIIASLIYGWSLASYLLTKGRKGMIM